MVDAFKWMISLAKTEAMMQLKYGQVELNGRRASYRTYELSGRGTYPPAHRRGQHPVPRGVQSVDDRIFHAIDGVAPFRR